MGVQVGAAVPDCITAQTDRSELIRKPRRDSANLLFRRINALGGARKFPVILRLNTSAKPLIERAVS